MKVVIVGGGLTGLSLAHWLHKNHHEPILLEAAEKLGGRFRALTGLSLPGIIPSEAAQGSLAWLRYCSPLGFSWSEVDLQPLQFDHSEWRPFLGFGEFPSSVVDELSFFSQARQWQTSPDFGQITRSLIEQLPIEARTLAEVTGFECQDGRVTAAVINGQEKILGDSFVFCPSPQHLNVLLGRDAIKANHRTRLAKLQSWTAVTLSLSLKEAISESAAIRIVLGTGKEFEPVVGRVDGTRSVWLNLVHSDRANDLEHIGDCVRHMKRTLRRVWPELLELTSEEKIQVRPNAYGKLDLKLKNSLSFPELANLHLADDRLAGLPGDLGAAAIGHQLSSLFVAESQPSVLSDSETV